MVFGKVSFMLWNPITEQNAPNTEVYVGGHRVVSDVNGYVSHVFPLSEQKTYYSVTSTIVELIDSIVYLPCGDNDVIRFK